MYDHTVTSGFLIEKTFARMCREFLNRLKHFRPDLVNKSFYSWPRTDVPPEQMPKQYRGLQREPIQGWMEELRGSGVVEPTEQELEASLFLTELERADKADHDFIFALPDAQALLQMIPPPLEREIIWARRMDAGDEPPRETELLGYEPSGFLTPCCESALADWMFFNYGSIPDEDGSKLREYHEKLNRWGLFDSPVDAERYLGAFLSFVPADREWHRYNNYITEVRVVEGT
ncbi:MAG: hypothetical protein JW993_17205 [Sedimentisphaerales bacterium]|nr:hypothetical protein [Sedimentisphaerales bacterium]